MKRICSSILLLVFLLPIVNAVDFRITDPKLYQCDPALASADKCGQQVMPRLGSDGKTAYPLQAGSDFEICVDVNNVGSAGSARVEAGFLTRGQINQFFFGGAPILSVAGPLIKPVQNCKVEETNVQTHEVTLANNQQAVVCNKVHIPQFSQSQKNNLGWFAEAFERCSTLAEPNPVVHSHTAGRIELVFPLSFTAPPAESCTDRFLNNFESDIDCGGPNCAPCEDGRLCNVGGEESKGGDCKADSACVPAEGQNFRCRGVVSEQREGEELILVVDDTGTERSVIVSCDAGFAKVGNECLKVCAAGEVAVGGVCEALPAGTTCHKVDEQRAECVSPDGERNVVVAPDDKRVDIVDGKVEFVPKASVCSADVETCEDGFDEATPVLYWLFLAGMISLLVALGVYVWGRYF